MFVDEASDCVTAGDSTVSVDSLPFSEDDIDWLFNNVCRFSTSALNVSISS